MCALNKDIRSFLAAGDLAFNKKCNEDFHYFSVVVCFLSKVGSGP